MAQCIIRNRGKYVPSGSLTPVIKTVDIPGMKSHYVAVADIVFSDDIPTAKSELKEWQKVNRIDTMDAAIKVTCFDEPINRELKIVLKV